MSNLKLSGSDRPLITLLCILGLFAFAGVAGCEEQGTFEERGEEIDEALDEGADDLEDAADDLDDAADDLENTLDDPG